MTGKTEIGNRPPRERLSLDRGWRFHKGDVPFPFPRTHLETYNWAKPGGVQGAAAPAFDDSGWRPVDVPHDWAVEGPFDPDHNMDNGYLPKGVAWYRRQFALPASDEGRRLWIEFDGVFRNATVWFNGNVLARHPSGYIGFHLDITDVANYGGTNTLAVRVDAGEFEGWWYEGAGIYRHVWLVKTGPLHVRKWGTCVRAEVDGAAPAEAKLRIQTDLLNESDVARAFTLRSVVIDPAGAVAATVQSGERVDGGDAVTVMQAVTVAKPLLWSVDTPRLYRLVTTVLCEGEAVDGCETVFGIRSFRFDPAEGFFLNGKPLKIKGTCNHQDHAGLGVALPDRVHEHRVERLKSMGCNAYRTAHHPPAPELLEACDRLGMLVMDENRRFDSSKESLGDLKQMILRDRNHPSVILWSLANEDWNTGMAVAPRIVASMRRVVRRLDPTRPVTNGISSNWWSEAARMHDVVGFNYSPGQYDRFHQDFPHLPMFGSETASHVTTRGLYRRDDAKGYLTAYDVHWPEWGATAENAWKPIAERPFMSGAFVWTGFDYRGEPTPFQWPCINSHFGILDVCGFPKDNYFYYKAWWGHEPVLHLFPHWNWPGREGEEIPVWCHSNCEEVEVLLNGVSQGRQAMPRNGHLEWKVVYAPGVLEARGFNGGREILREAVTTTGPAAGIALEPDRATIRADGTDVALVAVTIRDAAGRWVPVADNEVRFEVSANGRILGVGNGDPSSHEPDKASRRRAFGGRCLVVVQSAGPAGDLVLTACADGLAAARCTIRAQPCEIPPHVPSVSPEQAAAT